jgi:DNA-binding XRE family transcriptional regulator
MTPKHLSSATREAARLLGLQVQEGRRTRRWTQAELAERVGVSEVTMGKIERGDTSVALGTALEAAVLVGVPLFTDGPEGLGRERSRTEGRIALLPERVRPRRVDDDF